MLEKDAEKTKGSAAAFLPREHQNKVMLLASSYASQKNAKLIGQEKLNCIKN